MDQLPRLGKRELICLLSLTCNYVGSVRRGFLFIWVIGMGCVISLWHSLSLPYTYLTCRHSKVCMKKNLSCVLGTDLPIFPRVIVQRLSVEPRDDKQ